MKKITVIAVCLLISLFTLSAKEVFDGDFRLVARVSEAHETWFGEQGDEVLVFSNSGSVETFLNIETNDFRMVEYAINLPEFKLKNNPGYTIPYTTKISVDDKEAGGSIVLLKPGKVFKNTETDEFIRFGVMKNLHETTKVRCKIEFKVDKKDLEKAESGIYTTQVRVQSAIMN